MRLGSIIGTFERFLIVFIILSINAGAASFNPSDIEWSAAVSGTLYNGSTLTNGEYTVKAVQFSSPVQGMRDVHGNWVPETQVDPMVYLQIYRNNALIQELVMTQQSEPYIDPDYEVKVYVTGFIANNAKEWIYQFYNPWVTVAIETRAKPKIEVTVITDKASYTSYDDRLMTATVTVKNSGDAVAKNIDVNLDIGELKPEDGRTDQLHKYFYRLEKGASQSFSFLLSVPAVNNQRLYSMSATAAGYDVKDLKYNASTKASVTVLQKLAEPPRVAISKSVKDSIYLKDTAYVKITVVNGGTYDIYNIHVKDSVNDNFELNDNTPLQWDVPPLKPGQEWSTTYPIKPLAASFSGFIIPAATVQFRYNNINSSVSSQTTSIVVNGPKIILNKTVNKAIVNITEDVTVTVDIANVGNTDTRVEVKDLLPEGVSLVNGSTFLTTVFLEHNTSRTFSYSMKMNTEGDIRLPAAVANYTDIDTRGTVRAVERSGTSVITVIDPSKIPPPLPVVVIPTMTPVQETSQTSVPMDIPDPTSTRITPGFDITSLAIVLIVTMFFRRFR